jgi:hypothetical protein
VNHIWLRHFGRGLVPTPTDFGANGRPPSHPALVDWLAAEMMANGWSMRSLHRAIVTSGIYRMASTGDAANEAVDPDNVYLWRAPARRMEAELVRDNLLHVTGDLDPAMGGPEIDHQLGLKSKRRSLYLRLAAEKEVEFLGVFDGPSVNECYERHTTVVPQQALAMANSSLTRDQALRLSERLSRQTGGDAPAFVRQAFQCVLARPATEPETRLCVEFLTRDDVPIPRAREHLIQVLLNHNDFVSIR